MKLLTRFGFLMSLTIGTSGAFALDWCVPAPDDLPIGALTNESQIQFRTNISFEHFEPATSWGTVDSYASNAAQFQNGKNIETPADENAMHCAAIVAHMNGKDGRPASFVLPEKTTLKVKEAFPVFPLLSPLSRGDIYFDSNPLNFEQIICTTPEKRFVTLGDLKKALGAKATVCAKVIKIGERSSN